MHTTKLVLSMIAALSIAACSSTATTTKATAEKSAVKAVPAMTVAKAPMPAKATAPAATQLADGTYRGALSGKTATLVVSGGQPVSYNWGDYNGKKVSLSGNTIRVDAATLRVKSASANSIGGIWTLRGKKLPVTLTKG